MPNSRAARITRTAISPRLAIRIFCNTADNVGAVLGASTTPRWPVGWTVEHVATTGSTNDDLAAAADRLPDRSVLVADHQRAGRGRLDRRWDAPPGSNLLVSMLFRHVPDPPGELTRRVGLAALEACGRTAGVRAGLKWPNDLVVDGAKLAGILAERVPSGPGRRRARAERGMGAAGSGPPR